jgi:hypothetical protein
MFEQVWTGSRSTFPNNIWCYLTKKFTIEVSHASPAQLLTIAAELKIMSNAWEKFGPRIVINGQKLQAPSLREPRFKRQAGSIKRHNMARFI